MSEADEADGSLVTVSITFGDGETAERMAGELVENRLAACAQVWPIRSTYRWEGQVETADEHMLVAKTIAWALPALEAFVLARHSYGVPEIVAQPAIWANEAYAQWVEDSVGPE